VRALGNLLGRGLNQKSGLVAKLLSENMRWHYLHRTKGHNRKKRYPTDRYYGYTNPDEYNNRAMRDNEIKRNRPNYMTEEQVLSLPPHRQVMASLIMNDTGPPMTTTSEFRPLKIEAPSPFISERFGLAPIEEEEVPLPRRLRPRRGKGRPRSSSSDESDCGCDAGTAWHAGMNRTSSNYGVLSAKHTTARARGGSSDESDTDILRTTEKRRRIVWKPPPRIGSDSD
jgi:hypothetical protein